MSTFRPFSANTEKGFRFSLITGARNFAFVAPSHATLAEVARYADLRHFRQAVISHPNTFVVRPRNSQASAARRLLYVGRIDASKGIENTGVPCSAAQTVGRACHASRESSARPEAGGYALEKLTGTYRHHRASLRFYASFVGI